MNAFQVKFLKGLDKPPLIVSTIMLLLSTGYGILIPFLSDEQVLAFGGLAVASWALFLQHRARRNHLHSAIHENQLMTAKQFADQYIATFSQITRFVRLYGHYIKDQGENSPTVNVECESFEAQISRARAASLQVAVLFPENIGKLIIEFEKLFTDLSSSVLTLSYKPISTREAAWEQLPKTMENLNTLMPQLHGGLGEVIRPEALMIEMRKLMGIRYFEIDEVLPSPKKTGSEYKPSPSKETK